MIEIFSNDIINKITQNKPKKEINMTLFRKKYSNSREDYNLPRKTEGIRNSGSFALTADEGRHISNKELISIFVWWARDDLEKSEDF